MMRLLEQIAFVRIEARLAKALVDRADANNQIKATHQDLATMIGSAREVVSRRLEGFAKRNAVKLDRGVVTIIDLSALKEISQTV